MRYAKQISTGLMIESQGGGNPDNPMHLSIMVQNAVGAGLDESDVEVGYCTDAEHQAMLDAQVVANDEANPLDKWKSEMKFSDDTLPRWAEDLYDALPLEIRDGISAVTKNKIVQKKAQRELRPS
tara:strand:+ start:35 stop:409 length:375 start_codon:yes stop_codon:yes gene_type:complete